MPHAINHCQLSDELNVWRRRDPTNDIGKAVGTRAFQLVGARLTGDVAGEPAKFGGIELMARRVASKAIANQVELIYADFCIRLKHAVGDLASDEQLVGSPEVVGIRVDYNTFAEQVIARSGEIVSESVTGKVAKLHANSRIELFARAVAEQVVERGATAVAGDVGLNLDELQSNVFAGFKWPAVEDLTVDDFQNDVEERSRNIVLGTITGKESSKRNGSVYAELAAGVVAQKVLVVLAGKPVEPSLAELTVKAASSHISSC